MNRLYVLKLFIVTAFTFSSPVFGQELDNKLLSGEYRDVAFAQIARDIHKQTGQIVYYNPEDVDSFYVSVSVKNVMIAALLDTIFQGTEYHYAVYESKFFITKEREIRTGLPLGFFGERGETEEGVDVAVFDYLGVVNAAGIDTKEEVVFEIGIKTQSIRSGKANIAGYVKSEDTGEPVVGGVIYHPESGIGVATDPFGYYSISIPAGRTQLKISCIGMKSTTREIILYSDGRLDIDLKEAVTALKEVVVTSEREANTAGMQMGFERLDIKTLKQIPMALGEIDVLRVMLTLPGVQSVGESTTGLNVRGGATSQNLILLNDAVVYNPSHLFGFFSAFNPDVIKSVELYRSGIPAEYGGRLSSVLKVDTKEGNKKKFSGAGGLGLLTSRLTLEGPILKDKLSFLVGGRSTYSDWLLRQIPNETIKKSKGSFYDLNANLTYDINENNSLYLTGYASSDQFKLGSDTLFSYSNLNSTLKWKHVFSNKLYGVLTTGFSNYNFNISSEQNPVNAFDLKYKIDQANLKADFSYFYSTRHNLSFGLESNYYHLKPGTFLPLGGESLIVSDIVQDEQGLETALYLGDQFDISPKLSLYFGLRYSMYNYLGPQSVIQYVQEQPKTEGTALDTISYPSGKFINSFSGPEYRFSARYMLPGDASIKGGFQRMRQYIHILSNTVSISPTDIWKLSDPHILPEIGDQISLGFYKNFRSNTIETSVEGYYKTMQNFLDYKGGAQTILNHSIEQDVINTEGVAYGVEFMVRKVTGKLNGWISYTYSRSLLRTGNTVGPLSINDGEWYPSNFDKPHDATMVGNYKLSRRFSLSLNLTYSTGRPVTLPIAEYEQNGVKRLLYSDRNQYRIPDYFRADFSMNIEGNHKIRKLAHSSWSIAVYNLTGRKNAFSVFYRSEEGQIKGYLMSIFAYPIPTITYNFRF